MKTSIRDMFAKTFNSIVDHRVGCVFSSVFESLLPFNSIVDHQGISTAALL